jgi:hypothetical protein
VMDQILKNPQTNPKNKQQINFDRCTCGTAKGKKKKRSGNKSTAQAIYLIDDDFDINDYM